jgi:dTDP-glucose 4,6-dehydratase
VHFAAESHVDRSIRVAGGVHPHECDGHFTLLEQARVYWSGLGDDDRAAFRFLHVSTDEVYGTLGPDDPAFSEETRIRAEQPLCGVEGRIGPPGAGVLSHLGAAGADDELLE